MENPNVQTVPDDRHRFPAEGRELWFALAALAAGLLLSNFVLFGGFNLGFAVAFDLCVLLLAGYLIARGHRLTPYSALLLGISLLIGAGFARSDDGFVKFVMALFLFISVNLGLTLLAGRQRYNPAGILSLSDCFFTGFCESMENMGQAFSGLKWAIPRQGKRVRRFWAVGTGLLVALPVVFVMVMLLIRADAAFEGFMELLPEVELEELPGTLIFGGVAFCCLYTQGVSLQYRQPRQRPGRSVRGIQPLTIHTVLIAVCLVYVVYLLSQLAYLTGGLAGILPKGYTMAQYARRGFFEMAVLCGINLGVISLCVGLVTKKPAAPLMTRLLCLFIGAVTVFLVVTASSKMFLYMSAYGLTRLRLLTQVIMLWLGLSTVLVCGWLLVPRLPYMQVILAAGLIIGALVLWTDVDSTVARYNVDRYLSGAMEHIDTEYLGSLNAAVVPHLERLAREAPEEGVRREARELLETTARWQWDQDLRGWNYPEAQAQ